MTNKILFYQDYDLTTFALSKKLKEQFNYKIYAILDFTNNFHSFFKKQKIVEYDKTWFLYDHISKIIKPDLDYLKYIEKKYGIELWKIASNDRIFYKYNPFHKFSENEILIILEQQCKLFEKIFNEIKPDFVILPITNSGRNHIFYEMCLSLGIKILMLNGSRLGGRVMFTQKAEEIDYIENIQIKNIPERSLEQLRDILYKVDNFSDAHKFSSHFLKSKKSAFKAGLKYIFSPNRNIKTHYTYFGRKKINVLIYTVLMSLKKRYRLFLINKKLIKKIPSNEKFIYFPLITEPERGLLIAAPFHTNLVELTRHISKSLPIGFKLYVKDHPSMETRDWRPFSFYQQILDLPNTIVLHHSINPKDILPKCSMVLTIGGSAGFEAAFYEKPSITFVDALYSKLNSVSVVNNINELPSLIRKKLNENYDVSDLNQFVNLLEINSFYFDWSGISNHQHDILFFSGFLSDVEVTESQMLNFLTIIEPEIEKLTNECNKKILQHNFHKK